MMIAAASEKMCDGNKDDSSESSSRKRIPKASAKDAQLDENPAANKGANDSEDDVRNASEPAAARNFSREPSCNQAEEQPRNETVRLEPDSEALLKEHVCGEHEASKANTDCS